MSVFGWPILMVGALTPALVPRRHMWLEGISSPEHVDSALQAYEAVSFHHRLRPILSLTPSPAGSTASP